MRGPERLGGVVRVTREESPATDDVSRGPDDFEAKGRPDDLARRLLPPPLNRSP